MAVKVWDHGLEIKKRVCGRSNPAAEIEGRGKR